MLCAFSVSLPFNVLAEMVMRETLDGFQGRLQIGGWMIKNLLYTDDGVSRKYSLPINVDKTN